MHTSNSIGLAALVLIAAVQGEATGDRRTPAERAPEDEKRFEPDVFSYRLPYRPQIDLNGTWDLRRDPKGIGDAQGWYRGKEAFPDTMTVPGAPQAQGHGDPHQFQRTMFMEPFWIRRTFRLRGLEPAERVWLRLGAVLPAAEVYVNGEHVGYTKSSRTGQRVDITDVAKPGTENLIAIKVCDSPEVRMDGLLEWNEGTQKWTGPYQPIYCEIANEVSLIDAYVQPDLATGSIRVEMELTQASAAPLDVVLQVKDGEKVIGRESVIVPGGGRKANASVKLDDYQTWAPEHPQLYLLEIALLDAGGDEKDRVGVRFGMREISRKGTKFYLNGKPVFLRCFGDDHYYPDTLCPPSDVNWYLPRLALARKYGMNATKGCVEVMPRDYLEACDEVGIMVIQEMPFGLSTLRANRHTIDQRFQDYYASELEGLVRVSRNHASVVAYSMSSEMSFGSQTQASFDFFNRTGLPKRTRELAPHALVIDCTGYVNTLETAKGERNTDFYATVHPQWVKDILDEADMRSDEKRPMILHEYNWWSNYPDPKDKAKYANAQLKPFWLDTLLESARKNGQEDLIPAYHENSLRLQALGRKDGVEYARRNRLVEGYILWLLIDFGHWSEGLLDDFWQPKNVSPEEFLKSNGETVALLAKEGDRSLPMGASASIPISVSHYGEADLDGSTLQWKACGTIDLGEGQLDVDALPRGELTLAGAAEFEVTATDRAYKLDLEVVLTHGQRQVNTNSWSFWAFPVPSEDVRSIADSASGGQTLPDGTFVRLHKAKSAAIPEKAGLVIASLADAALADYLEQGGKCLLFPHGAEIENTVTYYGASSFYPLFRTIPWNSGSSGNSGTLISDHPAMAAFPHEGMCDLPFVRMMRGFLPMEFEPLRKYGVTPIIRGIDHYYSNRNNAYLLEFTVGKGKVVACSLGVLERLKENTPPHVSWGNAAAFIPNETLEATYLLKCFIDYAHGTRFAPPADVPREEFLRLFKIRDDFKAP
jgi:glycosyl hydrolase family 2